MATNEDLGLPSAKMKKVIIAFDIDGTLRNSSYENTVANERIRTLLVTLAMFKNTKIVVWSGGGEVYAAQVSRELGIHKYVWRYASKLEYEDIKPDIVIDDIQDTNVGKINLIVKEK